MRNLPRVTQQSLDSNTQLGEVMSRIPACLLSHLWLPNQAPGKASPALTSRRANIANRKWELPTQQLPPLCLSKATLSGEANERKGRALAQNDLRERRQLQIQASYHLIPTPSVPAPTLSGPGMPPLGLPVYMAGPWLP